MTKRIHQMTIADFERLFPDEDACKAYLVRHRWVSTAGEPAAPVSSARTVAELPLAIFFWSKSQQVKIPPKQSRAPACRPHR